MRTESYSSLQKYQQCPLSYKYKYIDNLAESSTDAQERGKSVHVAIATCADCQETRYAQEVVKKRISGKTNSTMQIVHGKRKVELQFTEQGFALSKDFAKVLEFEAPPAVFRGIVDFAFFPLTNPELGLDSITCGTLCDWKSGQWRPSRQQLEFYSLFFFAYFPSLKKLTCKQVFVDAHKVNKFYLTRKRDCKRIQADLRAKLDSVRTETAWTPIKSHLCGWCAFKPHCPCHQALPTDAGSARENLRKFIGGS